VNEHYRYRSCPVCAGQIRDLDGGYRSAWLARCRDCRVVFSARRPTDDELARHYANYGSRSFDSPLTRRRYQELLDSFEPYRRTNRILDIGCGRGDLLDEARKRGWNAFGTEFSARSLAIATGRGLNVVQAPATIDTFEAGAFDVITAIEVVEHLRDPTPEAQIVAHALRAGGLFYCTTPNFDSLSRRLVGSRWVNIEYPEHLFYFTAKTLERWLVRHGLEATSIISTGFSPSALRRSVSPSDPRFTTGSGSDEAVRVAFERSTLLGGVKRAVNRTLTALSAGDTLKGRFERRASVTR
jgi:2-polyprenyl-3-methyl-5-hydroxy-6-metoxy-1,4-benzoquinol methylase